MQYSNTECLSWTVKLLLFFRKILQVPTNLWFSSIFVYLNPFYYSTFKRSLMLQRKNHALRDGGGLLNRMEMCTFLLFCLNIIFFHLVLHYFISTEPPPMEHQWAFEPSVIVAYESLGYPQCERWISKSYSHCWKGLKYTKHTFSPTNFAKSSL